MKAFRTFFLIAIAVFSISESFAQSDFKGMSNQGTDFWLSFPLNRKQGQTDAIKIYVSCAAAVRCTLEIPAYGVFMVKNTISNGVIEFSLTPGYGQLYEKTDSVGKALSEQDAFNNGRGKGIHISAPVPVTVYGASRFAFSSDTYAALPTSALGKEYIIGSYADVTATFPNQHLPSQAVIVATFNNTVVSFKLGGRAGTETVGGMKIGQSRSWTLNKGDVIALANAKINNVYGDLSGSKVTANKPVAVFSGNQCAAIDITNPPCDFIMEQELPMMSWGKEYHVTRIAKRLKYSYIKIFAKEANTKLYRDGNPTPFYVLQTAGGAQGTGYYEGRILDNGSPRPVIIRADKPISIMQYNPGQFDDNVTSEPFQMSLTPVEQYQKEVTFNTPGINGSGGFQENYANIVFETNDDGTMPADLEFGIIINGEINWTPLKDKFGASAEPITGFPGDGRKYAAKIITLPTDGVYKFRASDPLAAYSYGFNSFEAYGHPAAVGLKDLTIQDQANPQFNYTQGCNGNIEDGRVQDVSDFAEPSNLSIITLLAGSSNYRLETSKFIPGDDASASWKLFVEDPTQDATANVYFSDQAGNDTVITVSYTAPATKLDQASLNFGLLKTCDNKVMDITIRNTSTTSPQIIKEIKLRSGVEFTLVTAPPLPYTLQPLEAKTYQIQFTSTVKGDNFKDSVIIEFNECESIGAELRARVGEAIIDVTDADFGIITTGNAVSKSITVRNIGIVPLTINGYSVPTNSTKFTVLNWNILQLPITLQPSDPKNPGADQINLDITFQSDSEGNFRDSILFISDSKKEGVDSIAYLNGRTVKTVGIEEIQNPSFAISPNPAAGIATITLPAFKSQSVFLKIFDALGNEVADFSNDLLKTELRFDTKTLPNGAYFLRFTNGKTTLNKTFIIQN